MKRRLRSCRKGSVLLPIIGFATYAPWLVFFLALGDYAKSDQGSALPIVYKALLLLCAAAGALFVGNPFTGIFLGIFNEQVEWHAEVTGVAGCQIWSGRTRTEKIRRELFRLGIALAGAVLAFAAMRFLPNDLNLRVSGFFAFWQAGILFVFYALFGPLKLRWPALGGFVGDPKATFKHAW